MDTTESIVVDHLNAWNLPTGPKRKQAIARVYSADVFIGEPGHASRGHDAMDIAIAGLQAQVPGATISRTGAIQTAQDLITYSWVLGTSHQPVLASGRDVLLIRDDKIVSLYVVLDAA